MDLTGSAVTGERVAWPEKVAQMLLTVDGMAFIPVITAIVVGARLTGSVRQAPRPAGGHVIVVGLGNVGSVVIGQLHDLGFDVVCVDSRPDAPGLPLARELGLPVVIGDAAREETLRLAELDTCLALVSVTSQDIVNLETALNARALREDLRIVIRLADDDLAERLQKTTGNIISRSVPYLAAPAFAAAMLEHQVLRTIAVGPPRAAHRRRPGRGPGRAGRQLHLRHRRGRAGPGARAGRRRGGARLVAAPRLPAR
jgi:voltage-gated potassium channel Kch